MLGRDDRKPAMAPPATAWRAVAVTLWQATKRFVAGPVPARLLLVSVLLFAAALLLNTNLQPAQRIFARATLPLALLAAPSLALASATRSSLWWLALGYLAYFAVAPHWLEPKDLAAAGRLAHDMPWLALFFTIILWLGARDRGFPDILFGWLGWVALLAAIPGMIGFYAEHPFIDRVTFLDTLFGPQVPGPVSNPNVVATIDAIIVLGLLNRLLRPAGWPARWLLGIPLILLLPVLLATGSRAALFGLGIALIALAAVRRAWPILLLLLTVPAVGFLLTAAGLLPDGTLFTRGGSFRLDLWRHYWQLAQAHPWIGYGMGYDSSFLLYGRQPIMHPHDIFLAQLLFGGFIGLGAFLLLLAAAARAALRQQRATGDATGLSLLLFIVARGLFDGSLPIDGLGPEWIQLWLVLGLIAGSEAATAIGPSRPARYI